MASPRISWLEAANLVSFVGEDASVEEILVFVDHERYLWRQTPYLIQRFPRFKQYLLDYRLSDECNRPCQGWYRTRSEEHTSELQSLMRISYAVFCLKNKNIK